MKWLWWALFVLGDVAIVSLMITLLCNRDRPMPRAIQWMFPLRGRWLWYFLISITVAGYLSLGPLFLLALVRTLHP